MLSPLLSSPLCYTHSSRLSPPLLYRYGGDSSGLLSGPLAFISLVSSAELAFNLSSLGIGDTVHSQLCPCSSFLQFFVVPRSPPLGHCGAPGAVFVPLLHLHSFPSCPAPSRLTGANVACLASRAESARVAHPIAAPLLSPDISEHPS